MNLVRQAFARKAESASSGGVPVSVFGLSSFAGEGISPQTALQLSAVWSANKILAETIGMLPLDMYRVDGESVRPFPKHPLQFYLHDEPNPEMSAMDWRMAMTGSLGLWGNAYARIARMRRGDVAGLWMLHPQLVNVRRDRNGVLEYVYYGQKTETYQPKDILHVRTFSLDGINGLAPVMWLRNSLGLAQALERYAGRFFANGAVPAIALSYPGTLSDEAIRNIRDSWKKLYGGADNAHEVAVLEENMQLKTLGVDPEKSQSLESREFQILEVARLYRIPPHMLAYLQSASYASIEQQSLEFVTYTLLPWIKCWEQAISRCLIDTEDKGRFLAQFNLAELLRGDLQSRYAAYAVGRQWGWLSVNDILRMENANTIGPEGDVRLEPMNMIEIGNAARPFTGAPNARTGAPPIPPKKMRSYEEYMAGVAA